MPPRQYPRDQTTATPSNPGMFTGSHSLFITGGTFVQHTSQAFKGAFQRLVEATAPGAFHNSADRFDPPQCHPNTRTAIIRRIVDWVLGADSSVQERRVFMQWLYGSAGVGKSAIAQSVAELCEDNGSLLASFFFSRTDPTRNNLRLLVATIAYQIALNDPVAKEVILAAIEHDPLIFSKSLQTQFAHLVFEPIRSSTSSRHLIIIDGLDECEDQQARCDILRLLTTSYQQQSLPPILQFMIASRPELDILLFMNLQPLDAGVSRLVLDGECDSNRDIRLFLQDKLNRIKVTHPHRDFIPTEWPSLDIIDALVKKASGQFIYASTVVKYVSSAAHKPPNRLDVILGLRPALRRTPFSDLDELYRHIFSTVEDLDAVLQVIGLVILGRQPLTNEMEFVLGLEPGDIEVMLSTLGSIVAVDKPTKFVRILHASLDDFLLDDLRSKELHIYPAMRHAQYAHMCLRHLASANPIAQPTSGDIPHKNLFDNLAYHLSNALPTAELGEAITNTSLNTLYRYWESFSPGNLHGILFFYCEFLSSFLSFIRASDQQWDDANKIFTTKRAFFDQKVTRNIFIHLVDPEVLFLVIAIFVGFEEEQECYKHLPVSAASKSNDIISPLNLQFLPDYLETHIPTDSHLEYLQPLSSIPIATHHLYIHELLSNPAIGATRTMAAWRYADSAEHLFRSLITRYIGREPLSADGVADHIPSQLHLLAKLLQRADASESLRRMISAQKKAFSSLILACSSEEVARLAQNAVATYLKA